MVVGIGQTVIVGVGQIVIERVGSRGNTKKVEGVGSLSWDCGFLGIGLVSLGRNFSTGHSNLEGLGKQANLENNTRWISTGLMGVDVSDKI